MATNTASLSEIRTGIAAAREFVLNERTLGQDLFAFCKQTFPQQVDLRLSDCTVVQEAESRLTVSGTFVPLLPWENVSVEFTLFDHPTSEIATQRHSIVRITIPDGYSAYTYLNQYDLEPGEAVSAEAVPYNPSLVDVIETINFNPAAMVFSSIDYSIAGSESIFYPDSLKTLFPAKQVKRGINFSAALTLDPDLRQYLAEVFGGSHDGVSTSQGLISPGEYGP